MALKPVGTFEEEFAEFFFRAILACGGSRYTAHACVAEWWRAVEQKEELPRGR